MKQAVIITNLDIVQRVALTVCCCDFSEPQYGKEVYDRILCLMKKCIRRYCKEGRDILTVADMSRVLSERAVKGISTCACVCVVDETNNTSDVDKIEGFSKLHSIQFGQKAFVSGGHMER